MPVSDCAANLTGERQMARYTGGEYPTPAEIARLAYDLYEMRGRQDGHDAEDWLLAEQQLTQHYWLVSDNT
jgi:hypothetical protein